MFTNVIACDKFGCGGAALVLQSSTEIGLVSSVFKSFNAHTIIAVECLALCLKHGVVAI